jgi:hypothetical protein
VCVGIFTLGFSRPRLDPIAEHGIFEIFDLEICEDRLTTNRFDTRLSVFHVAICMSSCPLTKETRRERTVGPKGLPCMPFAGSLWCQEFSFAEIKGSGSGFGSSCLKKWRAGNVCVTDGCCHRADVLLRDYWVGRVGASAVLGLVP